MLGNLVKRRDCWNFPLSVTRMKGKKCWLIQYVNDLNVIQGSYHAMRTRFCKLQIPAQFTLVRLEVKHMFGSWLNFAYTDLVNKYEDISFARFADYVIEGATRNKCFDRSSPCSINEHFRQVFESLKFLRTKHWNFILLLQALHQQLSLLPC